MVLGMLVTEGICRGRALHERGSEHVWMNGSNSGAFADGTDPSVRGVTVESLPVMAKQD